MKTGASKLYILDLKKEYIEDYIWPCLKAGADYETYLLGTSHARPCIAKALVDIGGAKNVYACATHGVLSGPAIERLQNSVIKEVFILDTIELPEHKKCEKIKQLSISDLFTEAIKRIYEGSSVSSLF